MLKVVISITCFFYTTLAYCQKETYNWFFGQNAGLNFNSGAPVFQPGSLATKEGCSSISDKDGNLLFYTDGITVWNRNHQAMPNGTGLMAGSTGSASQAALIVPHQGNDSLFYIFTVDETENISTNKGFRYSMVNMKRNGGTGDVTTKNTALLPAYEKEMIAGIRHGNGRDVWVVTHISGTNEFAEFLVTTNGLNTTPRIIAVGSSFYKYQDYGYLKFSPDGKRLAAAFSGTYTELFDFDVSTGNITNPKIITDLSNNGYCSCYGLEFSCDSKLLYIGEVLECSGNNPKGYNILQYRADLNTAADIINSRVVLDASATANQAGALQMGPDGKIYITFYDEDYLAAITRPGVYGTGCGYTKQFFKLTAPAKSRYGLPNFVQSFFNTVTDFKTLNNCASSTVSFLLSNVTIDSVRWDFGDPASGADNSSSLTAPSHLYARDGLYAIKAIVYKSCSTDTIQKQVSAGSYSDILGPDTALCEGSRLILKATVPGAAYYWQDASKADTFLVRAAGKYRVAITIAGCVLTDSIVVAFKPNPPAFLGNDTAVCQNKFPVSVGQTVSGASYTWNTGAATPAVDINIPGLYWREVSANGCRARDTILVSAKAVTPVNAGKDSFVCQGAMLTLSVADTLARYQWSNGGTTNSIKVSLPGIYWCDATNHDGCVYRDSVFIDGKPSPRVSLGNDTTICESTTLLLDATGAGDGYRWQNNSTASTCAVKDSGMYYVTVTKDGCAGTDTINVSLHHLPRPDLGNDIRICSGESVVLNPGVTDAVKIQWQDGSLQPALAVSAPGVYAVTVTNGCGVATDNITVETGPCTVSFPNAFTPDGNGANDVFKALNAVDVKQFRMQVFNRWGQKVFETNNPAQGWTGKTLNGARETGVYVWTASYTDNSGKRINRKGTVLLIR